MSKDEDEILFAVELGRVLFCGVYIATYTQSKLSDITLDSLGMFAPQNSVSQNRDRTLIPRSSDGSSGVAIFSSARYNQRLDDKRVLEKKRTLGLRPMVMDAFENAATRP